METVDLTRLVHDWEKQGLVSEAQAALLVASSGGAGVRVGVGTPVRGRSVLLEGVAYLGAAIVVAASILLGSLLWDELADAARISLLVSAALGLVAAGALVPAEHHTVTGRVRTGLWVGAVVAAVAALGVIADVTGMNEDDSAIFITLTATPIAALLWFRWRTMAQQAATMLTAAAAAAALVSAQAVPGETLGLGVWAVGVVWALLGWCELTLPQRFGQAAGSALAVFGAMISAASDAGTALVLVTLTLIVSAALRLQDPLMLGVAAVGVVLNVPLAAARWFPDSVAVPVALLAVGVVVVLAAVIMARRDRSGPARPEPAAGSPMLALTTASVLVASVAAVVRGIAHY